MVHSKDECLKAQAEVAAKINLMFRDADPEIDLGLSGDGLATFQPYLVLSDMCNIVLTDITVWPEVNDKDALRELSYDWAGRKIHAHEAIIRLRDLGLPIDDALHASACVYRSHVERVEALKLRFAMFDAQAAADLASRGTDTAN